MIIVSISSPTVFGLFFVIQGISGPGSRTQPFLHGNDFVRKDFALNGMEGWLDVMDSMAFELMMICSIRLVLSLPTNNGQQECVLFVWVCYGICRVSVQTEPQNIRQQGHV